MAAKNLAKRLIKAYKAGNLTHNQVLTECSKVIDKALGEEAWGLFLKGKG